MDTHVRETIAATAAESELIFYVGVKFVRKQGLREEITLAYGVAVVADKVKRFFGFNALKADNVAGGALGSGADKGVGKQAVAVHLHEVGNKRAVKLDFIHGDIEQVRHGGVAGAHIVKGNEQPGFAQRGDLICKVGDVQLLAALGQLKDETLRRIVVARE